MNCRIDKKCGGCQFSDISYDKEIEYKNRKAIELLGDFGKVNPIIRSKVPAHYRCKVTGIVSYRNKRLYSGIYERGSHRVLEMNSCLIEDMGASQIISDAVKLLGDFKVKAYNEDTGYGLVRYLQVRTACPDMSSPKSKVYMLTIVTSNPVFPAKNRFCKALVNMHPELHTIIQNVNDRTDSMILGDREQVLYGKGYIEDELLGKRFRISSTSFYQINGQMTGKLYQTAIDMLRLSSKDKLLDAYCGTGTIGIIASQKAGSVVGVELNKAAVLDARDNAVRNGVTNVTYHAGDAGKYLVDNIEREGFTAVIMDPPRSGASREFLDCINKATPQRIVYVACGIEALARDLKVLTKKYKVKIIQPVDMFPRTDKIEVCVLLSRI